MQPAIAPLPGKIRPLQVAFWGVNSACDLACSDCRGASRRGEAALSLAECCGVIDQLAAMGRPVLVFTGGDPLRHKYLFELIRHARTRGLRVGVAPAASPRLTYAVMKQFRLLGVSIVAMGLDAPDAATHDAHRCRVGSFARTVSAIDCLRSLGLTTWVNTAILPQNYGLLEPLAQLLVELDVQAWNLLASVPVSHGKPAPQLMARQYEMVFHQIYELSMFLPFRLQVSYAPSYRRVIYQRLAREGRLGSARARLLLNPAPMAADGSLYINHVGAVWPSGVMPLAAGSVRVQRLADIYTSSSLFLELRDRSRLKGRCSECNFLDICGGGCRARAFAATGDHLAPDPLCVGSQANPLQAAW